MGVEIINEHGGFLVCVFGGDLVEGGFDARVNFRVVEEGSRYCLDATFSVFFKERGGLRSGWLLSCCAAIDWCI